MITNPADVISMLILPLLKISGLVLADISCSLNLNHELARVHPVLIHRTFGVPTWNGTTPIRQFPRQFPSASCLERTKTSKDERVTRQRTPVSDSVDDKQWSETCPVRRRIVVNRRLIRRLRSWESTNLKSLSEDGREDRFTVSSTQQSKNQR